MQALLFQKVYLGKKVQLVWEVVKGDQHLLRSLSALAVWIQKELL